MTAYTIIPDSSIDGDSIADAALLQALRDNPKAIAEGDATAPAVVLRSDTTATTQSAHDNSTKVATTEYCENYVDNDMNGALPVGMIAYCIVTAGSQSIASLATIAGTSLEIAYEASGVTAYVACSGTWRNISGHTITTSGGGGDGGGYFQRIS